VGVGVLYVKRKEENRFVPLFYFKQFLKKMYRRMEVIYLFICIYELTEVCYMCAGLACSVDQLARDWTVQTGPGSHYTMATG